MDPLAPMLLKAVAMTHWHRESRFCPRCGEQLTLEKLGSEMICANARRLRPGLDCAVIMLITEGDSNAVAERCLLGRRAGATEPLSSTLAGYYEPGESAEDAERREVEEEAGVRVGTVSYFDSQSWPMPASLMLGYIGPATRVDSRCDPEELADARWFTREDLRRLTASGAVILPGRQTLARALIESWREADDAQRAFS